MAIIMTLSQRTIFSYTYDYSVIIFCFISIVLIGCQAAGSNSLSIASSRLWTAGTFSVVYSCLLCGYFWTVQFIHKLWVLTIIRWIHLYIATQHYNLVLHKEYWTPVFDSIWFQHQENNIDIIYTLKMLFRCKSVFLKLWWLLEIRR